MCHPSQLNQIIYLTVYLYICTSYSNLYVYAISTLMQVSFDYIYAKQHKDSLINSIFFFNSLRCCLEVTWCFKGLMFDIQKNVKNFNNFIDYI